ncbi:MAG: CBS domain-containing protein [Thermoplasmatota archaeon]
MNISEIMVKTPIAVELPTTRDEVLSMLVKNKRTGMPVVDEEGKILGMITRKHIFQDPEEEQVSVLMEWDVPTTTPATNVEKVAKIMFEKKERRLPVVRKGKLVGLVTPSDLLKVIESRKLDAPVSDYVMPYTYCIYEGTPCRVAATMINLSRVYAMPVLDSRSNIIGMVTDRDLFDTKFLGENITLTKLGISEDEDAWTWEGIRNVMNLYYQEARIDLPDDPVLKFMVKNVSTIYKKTPIHEAAKIMRMKDYDQIPVVDKDDNLHSMIHDMDLMKAIFD